ncbi:MAG: hypothetical protein PHD97_03775 [Bacteroidales bacterium]|nr:hypothetical protein [Bacteroidales bacterium]
MKKLLNILFLFVFLFQFFGYYFLFKANQNTIRNEIREQKCDVDKRIEKLKIPVAIFNKIKIKKDEIKYNNKLYDIKKVEFTDDTAIVYCINDTKEENIIAEFKEFVEQITDFSKPNNKQLPKFIFKVVSSKYISPENFITSNSSYLQQCIFFKYEESLLVPDIEVIKPPPKC